MNNTYLGTSMPSGGVHPIIMTARRMISALVLKYLNGDRFVIGEG
jgi:hypothetical protein